MEDEETGCSAKLILFETVLSVEYCVIYWMIRCVSADVSIICICGDENAGIDT